MAALVTPGASILKTCEDVLTGCKRGCAEQGIIMNKDIIEVPLSASQRDLLLGMFSLEPEHEKIIRLPIKKGNKSIVNIDPGELELLCGSVAFAANHEENVKQQRKYDDLFDYLENHLDAYCDQHGEL